MHLSSEHRGDGERVYQWIIVIVEDNIIIIAFISSKLLVNQATIWSKAIEFCKDCILDAIPTSSNAQDYKW